MKWQLIVASTQPWLVGALVAGLVYGLGWALGRIHRARRSPSVGEDSATPQVSPRQGEWRDRPRPFDPARFAEEYPVTVKRPWQRPQLRKLDMDPGTAHRIIAAQMERQVDEALDRRELRLRDIDKESAFAETKRGLTDLSSIKPFTPFPVATVTQADALDPEKMVQVPIRPLPPFVEQGVENLRRAAGESGLHEDHIQIAAPPFVDRMKAIADKMGKRDA